MFVTRAVPVRGEEPSAFGLMMRFSFSRNESAALSSGVPPSASPNAESITSDVVGVPMLTRALMPDP